MDSELEQILTRDLDDLSRAGSSTRDADAALLPGLVAPPPRGAVLLAAAVLLTALATVATILSLTGPPPTDRRRPRPPPRPPRAHRSPVQRPTCPWWSPGPSSSGASRSPVAGSASRAPAPAGSASVTTAAGGGASTPSPSADAEVRRPASGCPPVGGYTARDVSDAGSAMLIGADTEFGGEGFGGVDVPVDPQGPPPRAAAVTDDGLAVAGGPGFLPL